MSKKNHVRNNEALAKIAAGMRELRRATSKGQKEVTKETGINIGTIDRLCSYYGTTLEEFFRELDL